MADHHYYCAGLQTYTNVNDIYNIKKDKLSKIYESGKHPIYITRTHDKVKEIERYFKFMKTDFGFEINWETSAYIGDSYNDMDAMKKAKLTGCPNDAIMEVTQMVLMILDL